MNALPCYVCNAPLVSKPQTDPPGVWVGCDAEGCMHPGAVADTVEEATNVFNVLAASLGSIKFEVFINHEWVRKGKKARRNG